MQKILLYIFAFSGMLFFSNCTRTKALKFEKFYQKNATTVQNSYFKQEIPFKLQNRQIVIPVKIENETYDFLFDTGVSCYISGDLANKLKLKNITSIKSKNRELFYTKIPKITIGDVDFLSNLTTVDVVSSAGCGTISGSIGANLMRSAIWKIDYKNQIITLTNFRDSLNLGDAKNVDFTPYPDGVPFFYTNFSPYQKIRTLMKTTYYGDLNLPERARNSMMPSTAKYLKSYGQLRSANGIGIDTARHTAAPYLRFDGGWILQNNAVTFRKSLKSSASMGYYFLKDYAITLDWQVQKISFEQVEKPKRRIENTFGFYYTFADGKLVFSHIFENSPASEANLHVSEQILMMNGKDLSKISKEEYCNLQSIWDSENRDEITFTVKQKDGEKTVTLKKVNLDF